MSRFQLTMTGQSKFWRQDFQCGTGLSWQLTSPCAAPPPDNGLPRRNAAHRDGGVLTQARADKEAKCAELVAGNRCFLVVIALQTGGRWSGEAVEFIDMWPVARGKCSHSCGGQSTLRGDVGGCACALSRRPWWLQVRMPGVALTARRQIWLICWGPEF